MNSLSIIHKTVADLRVEIPEADYVRLVTLNDVVKYLVAKLP
jgi:hypothetical protein